MRIWQRHEIGTFFIVTFVISWAIWLPTAVSAILLTSNFALLYPGHLTRVKAPLLTTALTLHMPDVPPFANCYSDTESGYLLSKATDGNESDTEQIQISFLLRML